LGKREGDTPSLFFVSADSKGVKRGGSVTADSKGVEVPLECADTRGLCNCRKQRSCGIVFL
jgi:hypothetical protein